MRKSSINFLFIFVIVLILISIIKHPKLSLESAYEGLLTWGNIVVPSLFPFFVVSELLIASGFVNFISRLLEPLMKPLFNVPGAGAFSFSMSVVSGYPVGAKIVSNLRQNNLISQAEAERAICFSSTSGPLFMLGAVSIGMLNNPSAAPLIIYPHYLGAITLAFLLRFYKKTTNNITTEKKECKIKKTNHKISILQKNISIGSILSDSVKNSINTITLIGGFMIFYSVLTELLFVSKFFNQFIYFINKIVPLEIDRELFSGFIAGILEVTTGCKKIATVNTSLIYKITIINFLIGWSGFSIHSQALSFINKTDIQNRVYLFAKFLHGVFSSIYGIILYYVKYSTIIKPSFMPRLNMQESIYPLGWPSLFIGSFKLAIFITIYILLSSLILLLIYSLFSWD
ncbi:sporulation integral membrane protein YlbJ [Schnuerera sp.]|uniref:sporulation integral membrane protein YlbJ n=1 Tax=Schnuerera sp. TaxID=2794844 RepID=UPI002BF2A04D|nr:sporulation integral membrane protein YlbJ [Schnuerera sp.]HSH36506.1 sporulation integral membrane protein YlbJ [Schnuerera sp.]